MEGRARVRDCERRRNTDEGENDQHKRKRVFRRALSATRQPNRACPNCLPPEDPQPPQLEEPISFQRPGQEEEGQVDNERIGCSALKCTPVCNKSLCQLIGQPLILFVALYAVLLFLYRMILHDHPTAKQNFELLCIYANRNDSVLPVTLIVGYYVSQVTGRWREQLMVIPWPETFAMKLVAFCPGSDRVNKELRRTIMRYINLSMVLVFRLTSPSIKRKYPTYDSLVEAKLLLPNEKSWLENMDAFVPGETTSLPLFWVVKLLVTNYQSRKTKPDIKLDGLLVDLSHIALSERRLLNFAWIRFPLAYTQIATFAVVSNLAFTLFGCQFLHPDVHVKDSTSNLFPNATINYFSQYPFSNHSPDVFLPLYPVVKFILYMGWIKVAQVMNDPLGGSPGSFPILYILKRNEILADLIVVSHNSVLDNLDLYAEAKIVTERRCEICCEASGEDSEYKPPTRRSNEPNRDPKDSEDIRSVPSAPPPTSMDDAMVPNEANGAARYPESSDLFDLMDWTDDQQPLLSKNS